MMMRCCALSLAIASIESYLCRKVSVNCSVLQRRVGSSVCLIFDFRSIPRPRKIFAFSHASVPVLPVIPVLAANLSWRRGQPLWRQAHCLLEDQVKNVVHAFSTETRFSLQQGDCSIEKMGLRQGQNLIEDCLYSDVPLSPTIAHDGCMSQSGNTSWQSTGASDYARGNDLGRSNG
jgi:hypothetical protein